MASSNLYNVIVVENYQHNNMNLHRQARSDVLLSLRIPISLVWEWNAARLGSLVSRINNALVDDYCILNESDGDLEKRLEKKFSKICIKIRSLKGRKRYNYLADTVLFDIFRSEASDVSKLSKQVETLERKVHQLNEASKKKDEEIARQRDQNQMLESRPCSSSTAATAARDTPSSMLPPVNHGKMYDEVGIRQKQRKVSVIKSASETALMFVEGFGFKLEKIVLRTLLNEKVELSFDGDCSPCHSRSQSDESETVDSCIDSVAYLTERFGVSDETYHEFAQLFPSMPRLYELKGHRKEVSKTIKLKKLSKKYGGLYRPLKAVLAKVMSLSLSAEQLKSTVLVKISGDGTRIGKNNHMLMSFSIPSGNEDVLSAAGNHTFASVKSIEKYEDLKEALEPVLKEINELIQEKELEINGKRVKVNVVLGGDMKFLLIMLGLNAANSAYSCLWCEIKKEKRLVFSLWFTFLTT